MKILIILIAILGVNLSAEFYRVINHSPDDSLNVRTGPGVQFKKIGSLSYDLKDIRVIECTESKSKWCKILHHTTPIGWVSARYIESVNKIYDYSYKVIKHREGDFLNVRMGPGIEFKKIGLLAHNARNIKINDCKKTFTKGKNRNWCNISHTSTAIGWVSKNYLEKDIKLANNNLYTKDEIVVKNKITYNKSTGKKITGKYIEYFPNKNKKTIYELKNGLLNGKILHYYDGLSLKSITSTKNGLRNGKSYFYRKDGSLHIAKNFRKNKLNGRTINYSSLGIIKSNCMYINNIKKECSEE